jgi:molecular chaperone GrpE
MDEKDNKTLEKENIQESADNISCDFLKELKNKHDQEKNELELIIKDQEKNIIYLRADIENIKRNSIKDVQFTVNRQLIKVISSFLSIFDDYQRSIEYLEKHNNKDVLDGVKITYTSFLRVFRELEVTEIKTDGKFDPKLHEAINMISDESKESNTISQVLQKGFMYKNQVLRPAQVIIFA